MIDVTGKFKSKKFPEHVDASMLSNFGCGFRGAAKAFYGITVGGSISGHLIAGKAFAAAMESYRDVFYKGETKNHELALQAAVKAALTSMGGTTIYDYESSKTPLRVLDAIVQTLDNSYTNGVEYEVLVLEGKPAVEWMFSVQLPEKDSLGRSICHPDTGSPLKYVGVMDAIVEYYGMVCPLDDKTTRGFSPVWRDSWDLRPQFVGYVWALKKAGIESAGVLVNGISFPYNKTPAEEAAILHGNELVIATIPEYVVENWYQQLLLNLHEMIEAYKKERYSQNWEMCQAYGRTCSYLPFCKGTTIPYTVEYWQPLKRLESM